VIGPRPRRGRPAWLAVLRIARRDALRARGRSALVVALVALPIAAIAGADVFMRTVDPEPEAVVTRSLGKADARYEAGLGGPVEQSPDGSSGEGEDGGSKSADPRSLLPPGSRAIPLRNAEGDVPIQTRTGRLRTGVQELDYADPLAEGIVEQLAGRAPRRTGEVAITPKLREASGLEIGDTFSGDGRRRFTVVGVARLPGAVQDELILALPRAFGDSLDLERTGTLPEFLVDTPGPVTWNDVLKANRKGVGVRSRAVILDPPPRDQVPYYANSSGDSGTGAQEIAVVVVVAGMAVLEIVLLAGAAFAVGARRQSRSLALVAAAGGEARDLRRTVLAGGLLLGLAGAALGIAVGTAAAWLAIELDLAQAALQELPGSFDVRLLELAAIALFGALTGVLAAMFPARAAARQDVVAVLAGRRGALRIKKRQPLFGLVLALAGIGVTVFGAAGGEALVIVAGAVLAQAGLIVMTPAVVGAVGRLGRLLPVAPRLALRDASRQRSRTTPAVAAIMSAVAGSIAVSVYVVSLDDRDRRQYPQEAQVGQAYVSLQRSSDVRRLERIRAAVASSLPVKQTTAVRTVGDGGIDWEVPAAKRCPIAQGGPYEGEVLVEDDPRCAGPDITTPYVSPDVVGDADVLRKLTGNASPAQQAALGQGGAVFFSSQSVNGGSATAQLGRDGKRRVSLPAVYSPTTSRPFLVSVISPAGARRLGLTPRTRGLVFSTSRTPTEGEEQRALAAVGATGAETNFGVERGYAGDYGPGLLALLVASAVITLGAAGIATALAAVEGRPDQATLAAVGATPRVRKRLAAFQAAAVAGLGTAMGIVAGLLPGAAIVVVDPALRLLVPWTTLGVTLLAVPLLAMLAALALTRSRVPLERRLA